MTINKTVLYMGLDVHAESISIATADSSRDGEVRTYGRIPNDLRALDTVLRKLGHPDRELRVCYEAGPTGFVIARHLAKRGIACLLAAPSLIPKGKGDKIKTDRRDALMLARLHRAGELTAVHIPDAIDESIRDLCRARTDAVDDKRRATCRLKAFLLRHGIRLNNNTPWSEARMRTLRQLTLTLAHPAMAMVLEETIQAIDAAHQRIVRLEKRMEEALETWTQAPVVRALMGLRGFQTVAAMITVSELGDIHRFAHPRQLMAYLGLVPSESSSGEKRRTGGLTKTGNAHLRWLINESAQHCRLPPKVSPRLSKRQEDIPKEHREEVKKISWKCQDRLYTKGRQLSGRLKMRQKIQIALARELCGFIWAIMKTVQPAPAPAPAAIPSPA